MLFKNVVALFLVTYLNNPKKKYNGFYKNIKQPNSFQSNNNNNNNKWMISEESFWNCILKYIKIENSYCTNI